MPTILELFQNDQVLSNQVKSDKRTLVDVETSGIRVDTKVDINNPAIYGFEALRIADRSTEALDIQKNDRGVGGGLLGGIISKGKNSLNSIKGLMGFPFPAIPSKVIQLNKTTLTNPGPATLGHFDIKGNEGKTAQRMAGFAKGAEGTLVGKLLAQSLKGSPSTIGPQIAGGAIDLVKDKAREFLMGSGELKENKVPFILPDSKLYGSGDKKYSEIQKGLDAGKSGDMDEDTKSVKAKLDRVSPIHGLTRAGKMAILQPASKKRPAVPMDRFGYTEYAYDYLGPNLKRNETLPKYTPEEKDKTNYTSDDNRKKVKNTRKYEGTFAGLSLDERGVGRKEKNIIGLQSPQDDTKIDENGVIKFKNAEYKDLVPFHITRIGQKKNIFKSYITGLSETVSPSWSSNNFVGNPYKYYIYESIERSVTFTLNIATESAEELARNWEKLSHLTKAAYPLIPYQEGDEKISANIVSPPFIRFTLGDMYRERFGILDSLSYTVPDNTPWETDIDGFVLPKFIDASITIKFAEDVASGNVDKLYDFRKKDGTNFLTNPIN